MGSLSRKSSKKIIGVILMLGLLLSQGLSVFADTGSIVSNDPNYDPITTDLQQLSWEENFRSAWDSELFDVTDSKSAFNQTRSDLYSNGSKDHIVINGTTVNFYGYYSGHILDYLYYNAPVPADTTNVDDVFSFSFVPNEVGGSMWHSSYSFGFMVNCFRNADGTTSGYFVALETDGVAIRMMDNIDLNALAETPTSTSGGGAKTFAALPMINTKAPYNTAAGKSADVVIKSSYTAFTVSIDGVEIFSFDMANAAAGSIPEGYTGGNGFGLYGAYIGASSHACSILTYATISNIGLQTSSVANTVKMEINAVDTTDPKVPEEKRTILQTFIGEGYEGQEFTITPPAKIGKFAYVGEEDNITGIYGDAASIAGISLPYANPTIFVQNTDEKGAVISTEAIDGLDLNVPYEVKAKPISGYKPVGETSQKIELTKKDPTTTVGFKYDKLELTSSVPHTGDTNNSVWIAAAGASALAIVIGLFIRDRKVKAK